MLLKSFSFALIGFILLVLFSEIIIGKSLAAEKQAKDKMANRVSDPVQYSKGFRLYQANCSSCHGKNGEGAVNWRKVDEQGKNPAPPLNGSGHTWHHSTKSLTNTIKNGTSKLGGNMPAWKDKLSESEIKLILVWIKAQWPDELYTAWYNRFHTNK